MLRPGKSLNYLLDGEPVASAFGVGQDRSSDINFCRDVRPFLAHRVNESSNSISSFQLSAPWTIESWVRKLFLVHPSGACYFEPFAVFVVVDPYTARREKKIKFRQLCKKFFIMNCCSFVWHPFNEIKIVD